MNNENGQLARQRSNYNAYTSWEIDNTEAINDFDNLLQAIHQCRKHFHQGQYPVVFEETMTISLDIMQVALEKRLAIEVKSEG